MVPTYVELSNLEYLFKGDKTLIREWMGLYLQESPAYFDQLTANLERGDAEALASAAHDLKPQAHYLGSARMLELLTGIEEQAGNGDLPGCQELLEALLPVRAAIDEQLRTVLAAG